MYRMDWTDGRLQERFDSIDHRFDDVNRRFNQVDRRFDKVDTELQRVNDRLDGLHRVLMQIGGGIFVALLGLIATQL
jgi:DNA anti-recombination protein RmuC